MDISSFMMNDIIIKTTDFNDSFADIKKIRTEVFIKEQHVPEELEWDEFDDKATHFLAYYDNEPVATARLLNNGYIGRMAVLKAYRNRNIGGNMLKYTLEFAAKKSIINIKLSAQKHAVNFYEKHGFIVASDVYMDAGIPHYTMLYNNAALQQ